MKRWKGKCILLKLTSTLRPCRLRGRKKDGLRSLYKDMESCGGEYSDIQVMWNIIQSSSSSSSSNVRTKRCHYFRFCFRPGHHENGST